MFVTHQLEIRVIKLIGVSDAVEGANVIATPEAIGSPQTASWDAVREVYYFDGLAPGFFQVQVSHSSYVTATRRVQVHPKRSRILILLTPTDDADLGGPAPPAELADLIGVFPALQADADSPVDYDSINTLLREQGFEPIPSEKADTDVEMSIPSRLGDPFLARSTAAPIAFAESSALREIRSSPLVRAAGPVIHREGESFTILLPFLNVRFLPDVTRSERRVILEAHGLQEIRQRAVGVPVYLVKADAGLGLGIRVLASELVATGRVEYAEPTKASRYAGDSVTPTDYLWPGCWDRHLVRTDEAWELIRNELGLEFTYGRPDIILAVVDLGIESKGASVVNPDFKGNVSDGSTKVYQLYDFDKNVPNNDEPMDNHGVKVAGVCGALADNVNPDTGVAVGLPGVAPNVRLMGIIGSWGMNGWDDSDNMDAYRWITGLSGNEPGLPGPISPGTDVITCSLTFGAGAPLNSFVSDVLEHISRRARGGKGALLFFSAGNSSSQNVETYRPWGWHERAFSCAASTLDSNGTEKRAFYSGKGQVQWCNPSSSGGAHNPPNAYQTWGADYIDKGSLPSEPMVTTTLTTDVTQGSVVINVNDTQGLVPATRLLIGNPGSLGHEVVTISSIDIGTGDVNLSSQLKNDHPAGEPVISGARFLAKLATAASIGDTNLIVDDVSQINNGMRIVVGTNFGTLEAVTVTGAPDPATGTVPITALENAHNLDEPVYMGTYHHSYQFGGTSSATPLSAGIAALVLSVKPKLTWVEASWLMRETAVKIQEANTDQEGRWLDANGDPVVVAGGEVVLGDPRFSRHFGYGRLDAKKAVAAAIAYDFPRDLIIRNSLSDNGENPETAPADSPDIWVRNEDPAIDSGKYPSSYDVAGPHQDPDYNVDRWIYARIHNRGSLSSLAAWVRFYVASDKTSGFSWPDDFEGINGEGNIDPANWDAGTYFIGEVGIENVPNGGEIIVNIPWPRDLVPPSYTTGSVPFNPVLLVEITPQDGPLEGTTVHENNNLAQKSITIMDNEAPEVTFLDAAGNPLQRNVPVPSDSSSLVIPFQIHIKDLGVFLTEAVSFTVTWMRRNETETSVDFTHNGSGWTPSATPPATFSIGSPINGDGDPVSGNAIEAYFSGNMTVEGAFNALRIQVHAADLAGNAVTATAGTRLLQVAIPTDILLVLDYSGSMSLQNTEGQSRWASAGEAANLFNSIYALLTTNTSLDDRIGLVRFWTDGSAGPDLTEVTKSLAAPDSAIDLVDSPIPALSNFTPIGSGILATANEIIPGTPNWRSRVAILLTDGLENRSPMLADIRTAILGDPNFIASVEDEPQMGLRIHSCAFGPAEDISTETIQALAEGTDGGKSYGGRFHATSSTADPHVAYTLKEQMLSMIVDTLTAELIGPFDSTFVVDPGVEEMVIIVTDDVSFSVTPPLEHTDPIGTTQTHTGYSWVRIINPKPGVWAVSNFTPSDTVRAFAVVDLTLQTNFRIGNEDAGVGRPLSLVAEIWEEGVPLSGALVTATVDSPGESVGQILTEFAQSKMFKRDNRLRLLQSLKSREPQGIQSQLLREAIAARGKPLIRQTNTITLAEGDKLGVYEASWAATIAEGVYTVRFHAEGLTRNGQPFQRDYVASRYLAPVPDARMTTVNWQSIPIEQNPEMLTWTATIRPHTATGRPLGPGLAHMLKISAAKERSIIQDRLDGSYKVSLQLKKGQRPPDLSLGYGIQTVSLTGSPGLARRVRVVLERIDVKDFKEPWFLAPGELVFHVLVAPEANPERAIVRRVPERGHLKLSKGGAYCEDIVIFDAYVEEGATLAIQLTGSEIDTLFGIKLQEDPLARYRRVLSGSIGSWAGKYSPDDEPDDPESLKEWSVWFNIEVQ